MPIGNNAPIVDKLIKRTTAPQEQENDTVTNGAAKRQTTRLQSTKENATLNTVKMTFYIKQELLEQLYNYAYWDRYTVTEAFNIALTDGLKSKNTKPKGR